MLFILALYLYVVGMNGILNTFFGGNRIVLSDCSDSKIAMFLYKTIVLDNILNFECVKVHTNAYHSTQQKTIFL